MNSYYTILEIEPGATQEELIQAYQIQRERYNPERVAAMDAEIRQIAERRIAEIEQAYETLSNPHRRQEYDAYIGLAGEGESPPLPVPEPRILASPEKKREYWITLAGIVGALLLLVLVWILMGGKSEDAPAVPQSNRPAPDFTLPTPDGGTIRLSDYRGSIILVNFWGSWCDPCREELSELQSAYEQLRDQGFVIIGVNLFNNEFKEDGSHSTGADIQKFITEYGVSYPIALDEKGEVAADYRIFPIPTSYFVDRNGNIRYVIPREITAKEIVQWFNSLNQKVE